MTSEDTDQSALLGKSIVKGVLVGIPVAYLAMVVGLWLIFDRDLGRALETSALPGLLVGAFFGGFAGISRFELARARQERAARSGAGDR